MHQNYICAVATGYIERSYLLCLREQVSIRLPEILVPSNKVGGVFETLLGGGDGCLEIRRVCVLRRYIIK
jgi:hypothetical protein